MSTETHRAERALFIAHHEILKSMEIDLERARHGIAPSGDVGRLVMKSALRKSGKATPEEEKFSGLTGELSALIEEIGKAPEAEREKLTGQAERALHKIRLELMERLKLLLPEAEKSLQKAIAKAAKPTSTDTGCQSASKNDPGSASNFDPPVRRAHGAS